MGYLVKTGLSLDLKKAVISVFFQIPANSAAAALARDPTATFFGFPVMVGVIPLLTIGTQQSGHVYNIESVNAGDCPPGFPNFGTNVGDNNVYPEHQTCIGVQFLPSGGFGGGDTDYGFLFLNIATGDNPVMASIQEISPTGNCVLIPSPVFTFDAPTDASYTLQNVHENFGGGFATGPHIAPDQWYHLLLSWDVNGGCSAVGGASPSVTSISKLWCALNKVNKHSADLPGGCWIGDIDGTDAGDPNVVFSNSAAAAIGLPERSTGTPSSSTTFSSVPADTIWIPAPPSVSRGAGSSGETETINPVLPVHLAELQIFTEVTLNTGVEENVDAFVKADGTPETNFISIDGLLGKSPEIRMTGANNWKVGNNSGTVGNFTKTGTINTYSTTAPDISP